MKFSAIPKLTRQGSYRVTSDWRYLKQHLEGWTERGGGEIASVDLNPDFQRGHVWTREQQIAYVEYIIRGGSSGKELYFNCVGWQGSYKGPFVLVDGKQRLTAVLAFLDNEIPAFGHLYKDYEDRIPSDCNFYMNVNNLKTREEVLTWYLEMNSGGTPHTQEELQKVKDMLEQGKK